MITEQSSTSLSFEIDPLTKKNRTKLIYTLVDPDADWDDVVLRCEQIYKFKSNFQKDVSHKIRTFCKFFLQFVVSK